MQQQKIPEISYISFIRNAFKIVKNPLPFHQKNFEAHGDIFKLKLIYYKNLYFTRNAALAQYVLQKNQKNYTKSKIQTADLAKYIGKGLLTAEGKHWRKQRKLIQPAFHKKQLSQLLETIKNTIVLQYQQIKPNKTTDVFPIFNDLAFKTVVNALFSNAASSFEISRLQFITEASQNMLVKQLRQPFLRWWYMLTGNIKKHSKLTLEARAILKQMVNSRIASGEKFNDLLDMLLNAKYDDGSAMPEEQLIDEILILFVAGHETTSNALSFTLQLLALHTEWQDKIFNEAQALNRQSLSLMQTVMASKNCLQVIEEAIRLYPPVYFIDRVNIEADSFEGMQFKSQSNLLLSIYEIHRHPKLWHKPNAFLPERFIDGSQKYASQYFPFGAGPRKCIGSNFAMFEMIIAIRELVLMYKFKPMFKNIAVNPLITLKPKNAILQFNLR